MLLQLPEHERYTRYVVRAARTLGDGIQIGVVEVEAVTLARSNC
jgi:hypothetical protein